MKSGAVVALCLRLQAMGIPIWLDGGWGVDALLGEQTRPHDDLDIVVEERHLLRLRATGRRLQGCRARRYKRLELRAGPR
jgi:lincosamide nucleotidyltransferase A/C/D/E